MTVFNLDGQTNERDRLLSLLMEWTTEPRLITAMVMGGHADFPGIATLAAMVRATLDASDIANEPPKEGEAQPLNERQIAAAILAFLSDSETRDTIARYVSEAHDVASVGTESKYDAAKRELYELRTHLQATHRIQPQEIPELMAGDPVAHAESVMMLRAEEGLFNPAMAWPKGGPKPEWVTEYEQEDYPMPDGAAQLFRDMRPEVQEVAAQFPPHSLVRGTHEGMVWPRVDMVGFVRGYAVEDGEVVVEVAGWLDGPAKINCRPAWLELAATRGGVTVEAVRGIVASSDVVS